MKRYYFYPNPFINSATLYFENKDAEEHELKIFDIRGRLVRHYKNLTGQSVVIERLAMNAGVYFYQLSAAGKKKAGGKFVVVNKN